MAGGGWPDAEEEGQDRKLQAYGSTDVRKWVDSGRKLSKRCLYVLQFPRSWDQFEGGIERAHGSVLVVFDRPELVQGHCHGTPLGGDRHLWKGVLGWRHV